MNFDIEFKEAVEGIIADAKEMLAGIRKLAGLYMEPEAVDAYLGAAEEATTIEELVAAVDHMDLDVFPDEATSVMKSCTKLFYHYLRAELAKGNMICEIYKKVC